MKWVINYKNDVSYDEGFREWWEVTDWAKTFKCDNGWDAKWLANSLNGSEGGIKPKPPVKETTY